MPNGIIIGGETGLETKSLMLTICSELHPSAEVQSSD